MADEYIDIIDLDGNPTGEVRLKSEAHRFGLPHASVHVWCYTSDGQVLLQKRAPNKDIFPDLWDISVAGHIGAGELPKTAAVREVFEEIGISLPKDELFLLTTQWANKQPTPSIIDHELHYIYLAAIGTSDTHFVLQEEEVSEIRFMRIADFIKTVQEDDSALHYVPHGIAYYQQIASAIANRIH